MKLTPTPGFLKDLGKLKPNRRDKVIRAMTKFLAVPMPASLCFRPLAGLAGYFIIDSSSGDRIILRRLQADHFEAVDFGPHDIYRRWNRK